MTWDNSRPTALPDMSWMQAQRDAALEMNGRKDAGIIFSFLIRRVKAFQSGLGADEELGLRIANFGIAAEIHIRHIAYTDPSLIEFSGIDAEGNEVTLIQHISQLNFMLSALKPIQEEPYRIGFR